MATSTTLRPASARGRLPAPVRDRRPALAALALLLVLAGALASGLIAYRSGNRVDVLVAQRSIAVGEVVQRGDFRVARVASEGASVVEASAVGNFAGTRAVVSVPAGTVINNQMFTRAPVLPRDGALVGVVLSAAQRPVESLRRGDVVRVYAVPDKSTSGPPTVLVGAARVAEAGSTSNGGSQPVSLLVPTLSADTLIGASTHGAVSVAKLAAGTAPALDFAAPQ